MNQMLESVAIWMMAPAIAALTVGGSTVPERVAAVEPVSVVIHVAQNKTNNTSGFLTFTHHNGDENRNQMDADSRAVKRNCGHGKCV